MSQPGSVVITGKEGVQGIIEGTLPPTNKGESETVVVLENGQRIIVPTNMLVLQENGSYYLAMSLPKLDPQMSKASSENGQPMVLPIVAEEIDISKRKVETGRVRISKVVHEREELINEPLIREEVHIERVNINQVVDGPKQARYEDGTLIIPVLEEVLVVEKRLMLKEELYITFRRVETHKAEQVKLRREEAVVERVNAQPEEKSGGKDPA